MGNNGGARCHLLRSPLKIALRPGRRVSHLGGLVRLSARFLQLAPSTVPYVPIAAGHSAEEPYLVHLSRYQSSASSSRSPIPTPQRERNGGAIANQLKLQDCFSATDDGFRQLADSDS